MTSVNTKRTALWIVQTAAALCQLPVPSTCLTSTDNNVILLRTLMQQAARELKSEHDWPELQKEWDFTLATSTDSYALPGDFDRLTNLTEWNRTQRRPMFGPISSEEWQLFKSGLIVSLPSQRFRIKGVTDSQFFIDPTPTASENTQTCVFEYISSDVWKPIAWVTGTSFAASSYCFNDGRIYFTSAGGTAGATAPTHTTGSASDGTVTWVYKTGSQDTGGTQVAYDTPIIDTDESVLHPQLLVDRTVWMFKRERGLDYEALRQKAEALLESFKTKLTGAPTVSLQRLRQRNGFMIGEWSYPEGNF